MGGLFRAPKPIVVPAPQIDIAAQQQQLRQQQAEAEAAAARTAEEARIEARRRARQGLAGTIATSARGVLEPLPLLGRKSLLGE
ncbi:MAG: hypothetical protein N3D18_13335 [Roseococcus sp.]|nr:hypothetical protein [Roseococcus sp.]